jgi:hypothetical protein
MNGLNSAYIYEKGKNYIKRSGWKCIILMKKK